MGEAMPAWTGLGGVMAALAAKEGLTVRQLAQRVGGYGGLSMVGTPDAPIPSRA